MKKIITILLVFLCAFACCSCQTNEDEETTTKPEEETTTQSASEYYNEQYMAESGAILCLNTTLKTAQYTSSPFSSHITFVTYTTEGDKITLHDEETGKTFVFQKDGENYILLIGESSSALGIPKDENQVFSPHKIY